MCKLQLKANVRSGPNGREYSAIADRIAADRPGRILDRGGARNMPDRHGDAVRELRTASGAADEATGAHAD